jgi:hypothetical protein
MSERRDPRDLESGAIGFCLGWRYRAVVSKPDPRVAPDQLIVWQCRHTDHATQREARDCAERYIRERLAEGELEAER